MHRRLLPLISVLVILTAPARAQENGFACEDHNLFLDHLSAIPNLPPLPDGPTTKLLATKNFSGFSKYGFDSASLKIYFDPDNNTNSGRPSGRIRVDTKIESDGNSTVLEIRDVGWKLDPRAELATLLRVQLVPADLSFPDSGSPKIRFEQPEPGVPIFLVKFIGAVSAGGRGDVDSDNAMVLDLRNRAPAMPAALGCIKDDFGGQGPGGGWAKCHWDHLRQDYDCATSDGEFFLVSGAERIHFRKGHNSGVVTAFVAPNEVKRYVLTVAKADQRLAVQIDSANRALKFAVLKLAVDWSGEMKVADCASTQNTHEQCSHWEGTLPDPADYLIELRAGPQDANYTLTINIH